MFEISLTNDLASAFLLDAETRRGFDKDLHRSNHVITSLVTIKGLSYADDDHDLLETESITVCLCGSVFYRMAYDKRISSLSAETIWDEFQKRGIGFLDIVKGNFVIVIVDKKARRVFVAKDQLGLKPLYYRAIDKRLYFSTNLNDFKLLPYEVDKSVVLEHLLFSYPIGSSTFIKEVFSLEGGHYLELTDDGFTKTEYFNVSMLFPDNELLSGFDINHFSELFRNSVVSKAAVSAMPNVTLTGGFDGRTNIAVLLSANKTFNSYSFGKRGGENTEVPINVAQKIGFNYNPVYLEEDYEQEYVKCASDALWFSDGVSRFERANYIFAMKKIAIQSSVNITGLLAEAYAPVHSKSDYINELYYDLVYCGKKADLSMALTNTGLKEYINPSFFEDGDFDAVKERIDNRRDNFLRHECDRHCWVAYLKDLITLGFPRFYGVQMHLERYFCENLSTFYDIDLLAYLYSTKHLKLFRHAFKNSPFYRINNRKIQSNLIIKYSPALGRIPVDRGYPPSYNLGVKKLMIPLIFFKRERSRKRNSGPKDFDTPRWAQHLFSHMLKDSQSMKCEIIDAVKLIQYLEGYSSIKYDPNLTRLIGLSLWLNSIQNTKQDTHVLGLT